MAKKFNASEALDDIFNRLMNDTNDEDAYTESVDGDEENYDDSLDDKMEEDIEDELDSLDDDDDDIGDIDDAELADLAGDLDGIDMADLADELEQDAYISDEDRQGAALSPSEEIEADDLMQTAGTACLIKSEMDECQKSELLESADDLRAGLIEGFLTESMIEELKAECEAVDLDAFAEDSEFEEKAKIGAKTKVIFNKQARLNQLFSVAVNVSARAHNDPMYTKYMKVSKLKRMYRNRLQLKYKNEATKRMKVMFARLKNSKSPILNKLGSKMQGVAKKD